MKEIDNNLCYDSCPLCGSNKISLQGEIEPVEQFSSSAIKLQYKSEYWKCLFCKSNFKNKIIPEHIAEALYTISTGEKWKVKSFTTSKTSTVVETISHFIRQEMDILDIGCNYGELLDFVKTKGAKTYGTELSDAARAETQKNEHIIYPGANNIPDRQKFDIIFAFDVVEHLYGIKSFFQSCAKLLKENGKIIILTGNPNCISAKLAQNRWWYIQYPEHTIFPSKTFFETSGQFKLEKYLDIYNSIYYKKRSIFYVGEGYLSHMYHFIKSLIRGKYDGLPLLGHDHALIILSRTETT